MINVCVRCVMIDDEMQKRERSVWFARLFPSDDFIKGVAAFRCSNLPSPMYFKAIVSRVAVFEQTRIESLCTSYGDKHILILTFQAIYTR